jgi:TRAP-type mannitol/chloroaromatic compound transport system substrate-binding protein
MIRFACKSANDASLGEYTYENGKALRILKEEHGIEPRFFSDEIMLKIGKLSEDVVREIGNSDPQTQKIYDAYIAARDTYRGWTEMSDGRFIRAREAALRL